MDPGFQHRPARADGSLEHLTERKRQWDLGLGSGPLRGLRRQRVHRDRQRRRYRDNSGAGDSIVRVSLAGGNPTPTDYFTPYNQASLDAADTDVGSGGVLVIPQDQTGPYPHILLEAGKAGKMYVLNRDQMTSDGSHYCNGCTGDPEIIQSVIGFGGLWSMPAYWNWNVYIWGSGDHLKAYSLSGGLL